MDIRRVLLLQLELCVTSNGVRAHDETLWMCTIMKNCM
jgi:hypothetical protein